MPFLGKRFSARIAPCIAFLLVLLAGCEKKSKLPPLTLYEVSGTVTVGKTPLGIGTVTFHPDAGKGNTLTELPIGMINPDGTYKLITRGKDGAPAGWYKVTVAPIGMPKDMPAAGTPLPKAPSFDAKYQKAGTTQISIQVVETPAAGAYNIEVK